MSIHLVIDGYNATMAEAGAGALAPEEQRERILGKLAAYRRARGAKVTVVFDAASGTSAGGTRGSRAGVTVVFTAIGESADERIEKMTARADPGTVVVTSDRTLADRVRRRGIETIDSASFLGKVEQAILMAAKGWDPAAGAGEETEARRDKKGPARRLKKAQRRKSSLRAKL